MRWDLREGKNKLLADFINSSRVSAWALAAGLLFSSTACATDGDCAREGLPSEAAQLRVPPIPQPATNLYIAEYPEWTRTPPRDNLDFIGSIKRSNTGVKTYGVLEFWPLKPANDSIIGAKQFVTSITIHGEENFDEIREKQLGQALFRYRDFKSYAFADARGFSEIEPRLVAAMSTFRQGFLHDLEVRGLRSWLEIAAKVRGSRASTEIDRWFVLGTGSTFDKASTAARRARGIKKEVVDFDRDVRAQYEADLVQLLEKRGRLQELLGVNSPFLVPVPGFPSRRVLHPLLLDYIRKQLNDKANEPYSKVEVIRNTLRNSGLMVEQNSVLPETLEGYLFLLNMFPLNPLIGERQRLKVTSAPYGTLYVDFVGVNGRENLHETAVVAAQMDPHEINADNALQDFRGAEQNVTRRLDDKKAWAAKHIQDLFLRNVAGNREAIYHNQSHVSGDDQQFSPISPMKDGQLILLAQRLAVKGLADEHRIVFVHGKNENGEIPLAQQGIINEQGQDLHKKLSGGLVEVVKLLNASKFELVVEMWPRSDGHHTISLYMLGGNSESDLSSVLFRLKVKLKGHLEDRGWQLKDFRYLRSLAIPPISSHQLDFRVFAHSKKLNVELINSFARAV